MNEMLRKKLMEKKDDDYSNILSLETLRNMFFERLVDKIITLFRWRNLPFHSHELDFRAIIDGFAGVVKDGKIGIMTAWGGMSGTTQYEDYFKKFTYAAPTAEGGTKTIGVDCVILRNTENALSLFDWLLNYADLYAHNVLSLKMALVNSRYQDILKTTDSAKAETLETWWKGLYSGKMAAIIDDSPMSEFLGTQGSVSALDLPSGKEVDFTRFTELENELTRSFYRELGVRWNKDKKANLVAGEVEQDDMLLQFNIQSMLASREEFCKEYNRVFGGNISVSLVIPLESEAKEYDVR